MMAVGRGVVSMLKRIGLLGLIVGCLLFAACSQTAKEPVACDALLTAIQTGQEFSDEMMPLDKKVAGKYLNIDLDQVRDFAMSMDASRYTAEQIVVLTAENAQDADALLKALTAYRDHVLDQYRDYEPAEVPKLESAVLRQSGAQVALIVSSDADAAAAALDKAWK